MGKDRHRREIVEHTSPIWRVLAVALAAGAAAALGYYFQLIGFADQFATVLVVTIFFTISFWARKRPDRFKARFGPFGRIADAIRESGDEIRTYVYNRPLRVGMIIAGCYGMALVIAKSLVVALLTNVYAWPLAAAVGCAVAALVAAPEFFSSVFSRMSVGDEPTREAREVEGRDDRESIERGERVSDRPKNREETRPEEGEGYRRDAGARFASPEGGIGYYDEQGNPLSPEEFSALVARDARLREEEDDG